MIMTMPDGKEVEYDSQSAAAKAIGLDQSKISEMCRGYRDEIRGHRARFKPLVCDKCGKDLDGLGDMAWRHECSATNAQ